MGSQIEIEVQRVGEARGMISTTLLVPDGSDPDADLIELRLTDSAGASTATRLSRSEAETFALALARIVDDFVTRCGGRMLADVLRQEARTITRDELLKQLLTLPRDVEINVNVAGEQLAITGLVLDGLYGGLADSPWYSFQLNRGCVEAALESWHVPPEQRQTILDSEL
ncbi:hypothetical protein [Actinoplanes sp. NBRC 103695]|uniref:hypothetical protein n=1 Tax=Actinoplanes sp. NBRC 103695 TaxID=3032202 RepID=UPI0024A23B68|nr:hypothetical protein [Actinoplanes sp. NBRC 103695]GLY97728.1 hypothetical protein Acsp02_49820 [Actinoplanes sp. NBRC 103695]